ncbi:alpha-(1-_3)-arabinofuranosyltransferase [Ornithinibacter aureus]|uniref:Alpha-(1->3)-arabinofuranosyltransferase n=1 Tax=Ornithinibacter aureus TaxID=622664 RepID=A0ABP8JCP2_9MICO
MRTLAGLLVVWSVAWSVPRDKIAVDTKVDLYLDPWGFLARSLHVWDPQVTWGGLQNQAYGYLFPMGPFFGLGSEILPMWVVQRLWWMALLTAGFLSMMGLLRVFGIGGVGVRVIASLAYVLAPRVIATIGGLSSEAHAQLLAPAILLPLVMIDRGELGVRRGVALSGLAILCCGGVNATATAFAILPSAVWLLTRRAWWRDVLTGGWGAAVLAATSWWLVPLVVLGRYSPPFLDWIENAQTVTARITLFDAFRGTTHWLGHLVTSGGVWWPAGFETVSSPVLILATAAVSALGLAGFLVRSLPHRRFLVVVLALGVLVLALPHQGALSSPLSGEVQGLLDGPLAPLRNVHKADLLIRLPLVVGLAYTLTALSRWRPRRQWMPAVALGGVALTVVGAAAPGFSGDIAPRGSFAEVATHWQEVGRWLDDRGDGRALIVPASSFGEYFWGRPMDEPLRSLTSAPFAVRDAVPLTPAGTIRLLDEIESRLQTGGSLGGATSTLRSSGVRYLVLRNDLAVDQAGQPPVALSRSALINTPDVQFVKGFGKTVRDGSGERVFPVEVYAVVGDVATDLEVWDADGVMGSSGASEDLARLADAGLGGRPIVFDGDRQGDFVPGSRALTDGFRARDRWFGAPRGQDVTSGLDARRVLTASDYLPWPGIRWRSLVAYTGIRDVRASTSLAQDFGPAGLQPAHRAYAAVDGSPSTSWLTAFDPDPTWTVVLDDPADIPRVVVTPARVDRFGQAFGVATNVTVTTDAGSVDARLSALGEPTSIDLPPGATTHVSVRVRDTAKGKPSNVVTGLSNVAIPGLVPVETVATPTATVSPAETTVLGAGLPGREGCAHLTREFVCYSGVFVAPESTGPLVREVKGLAPGQRVARGTLAVDPATPPTDLVDVPGVAVTATSVRAPGVTGLPASVVDTDPRTAWSPAADDVAPTLTITLDQPVDIEAIRVQTRSRWSQDEAPVVSVRVDDTAVTLRVPEHGVLKIPPTTARVVTLRFAPAPEAGGRGLGALAVEEVQIVGQDFPTPVRELSSPCGEGPELTIDGQPVPTRAQGSREALFGAGDFTWEACAPVTVRDGDAHTITVGRWRGLAPRSAVLAPVQPIPAAQSVAVPHRRTSPTAIDGEVAPSGSRRVLVMSDNANPGWQASLGGQALEPQVVDGRRQAFVVPEGAAGRLTIDFAPDRPYRWGLAVGALLAGILAIVALWPERGPRREPAPVRGDAVSPAPPLAALVWSGLIAGPAGLAAGAVGVGISRLGRHRRLLLAAVVAFLCLAAAGAQVVATAAGANGSVVEGCVRLMLIVAFAIAMATQDSRGERRGR